MKNPIQKFTRPLIQRILNSPGISQGLAEDSRNQATALKREFASAINDYYSTLAKVREKTSTPSLVVDIKITTAGKKRNIPSEKSLNDLIHKFIDVETNQHDELNIDDMKTFFNLERDFKIATKCIKSATHALSEAVNSTTQPRKGKNYEITVEYPSLKSNLHDT